MQKLLMSRKGELEVDLTRARGTDFSDATTDQVTVGNKVGVTNLSTNKPETFIVLGAWDGDPDNQITQLPNASWAGVPRQETGRGS